MGLFSKLKGKTNDSVVESAQENEAREAVKVTAAVATHEVEKEEKLAEDEAIVEAAQTAEANDAIKVVESIAEHGVGGVTMSHEKAEHTEKPSGLELEAEAVAAEAAEAGKMMEDLNSRAEAKAKAKAVRAGDNEAIVEEAQADEAIAASKIVSSLEK